MIEDDVRRAFDENRVLRILYQTNNPTQRPRVREIEVYAYDETYADAFCRLRGQTRSFRIDRMITAELLETIFERNPEVEHEIKLYGLSKLARQCLRPCCRSRVSETDEGSARKEPPSRLIRWVGPVLRLLGLAG